MAKRDIAALVYRILGVFAVLYAFEGIPCAVSAPAVLGETFAGWLSSGWLVFATAGPPIASFAIGMPLWYLASSLASAVLPSGDDAITARDIAIIGFSAVGIFILAFNIPRIFSFIGFSQLKVPKGRTIERNDQHSPEEHFQGTAGTGGLVCAKAGHRLLARPWIERNCGLPEPVPARGRGGMIDDKA